MSSSNTDRNPPWAWHWPPRKEISPFEGELHDILSVLVVAIAPTPSIVLGMGETLSTFLLNGCMSEKQVTFCRRSILSLICTQGLGRDWLLPSSGVGLPEGGGAGDTSPSRPATWPPARSIILPGTWGYSNSRTISGCEAWSVLSSNRCSREGWGWGAQCLRVWGPP